MAGSEPFQQMLIHFIEATSAADALAHGNVDFSHAHFLERKSTSYHDRLASDRRWKVTLMRDADQLFFQAEGADHLRCRGQKGNEAQVFHPMNTLREIVPNPSRVSCG